MKSISVAGRALRPGNQVGRGKAVGRGGLVPGGPGRPPLGPVACPVPGRGVLAGGVPHHNFHVFGVYPWAALLGDDRKAGHADGAGPVPDQVGKVTGIHGDQAAVDYRPPCWAGRLLTLGEAATEMARLALDGTMPARGIGPGDRGCRCTGTGSATSSPSASSALLAHVHHAPPGRGQLPRGAPGPVAMLG